MLQMLLFLFSTQSIRKYLEGEAPADRTKTRQILFITVICQERSGIPLVHTTKTAREKFLERQVEESKKEVRQLTQEMAKLRSREQVLSLENKVINEIDSFLIDDDDL